jgi:hypothetical protein
MRRTAAIFVVFGVLISSAVVLLAASPSVSGMTIGGIQEWRRLQFLQSRMPQRGAEPQ